METDKQFYSIFETEPQWIFELTDLDSPGPCKFHSMVCKAIERRLDGLLIPAAPDATLWVVELQMYSDQDIYNRTVVEMALVQKEYPGRRLAGMIIFLSPDHDPKTEPWTRVVHAFYLPKLLEDLERRVPRHPLVALFQPLLLDDLALLEQRAAAYYNQIRTSSLAETSKTKMLDVFVNWLEQRFKDRGKTEIETMLIGELPDLRETQSGKDLIAIGVRQGIDIGIEKGIEKGELIGQIRLIEKLLRLPISTRQELEAKNDQDLRTMLDSLQARLPQTGM